MNDRSIRVVLLALGLAASTREAAAETCDALYDSVHDLDGQGKVIDARKAAGRCMNACNQEPGKEGFASQCEEAYKKAERDTPSVVFEVLDAAGAPTTDATIALKGPSGVVELAASVDPSKAFPLDPTIHTFVVTLKNAPPGAAPKEIRVTLARGQQNTPVRVSFKPDAAPPGPVPGPIPPGDPGKGGVPVWAWVVGGFGIASLGTGLALIGVYVDGDNVVKTECVPPLDPERKASCDAAAAENNVKGWLGGIFTGVGVTAVTIGIVGIATAPKAKPKTATVDFIPVAGPGLYGGVLRGAF